MELGIALLIGTIITAVGSWVTTQNSNEQSQINQANQNNWNAQQAQIQRDWENPAHQMELYKQAGINPMMAAQGLTGISGQGIVAQNGSGAQTFPYDVSKLMNLSNDLSQLSDAFKTHKETGWIDRLNEQQIEVFKSEFVKNHSEALWNQINGEELIRMDNAKLEEIQEHTNLMVSEQEKIEAYIKNLTKQNEKIDSEIEKNVASINETNANIDLIKQNTVNAETQNENIKADTELKGAEAEKMRQDVIESCSRVGLNNTKDLLMRKDIDLRDAQTQTELRKALELDYKLYFNKEGYFPEAGFISNFITVGTRQGDNAIMNWNSFINNVKTKIRENQP